MLDDYLSPAELHELTERSQPAAQIRWLRRRAWRFTTSAEGRPRVLRAYRDRRLGGADSPAVEQPEPDWRDVA
jgi:hypothetical protein